MLQKIKSQYGVITLNKATKTLYVPAQISGYRLTKILRKNGL
jgi:hypothetical protein